MTDTTPAALERIMERLRDRHKQRGWALAGEAAAVIAALGVERNKVDEARRIDQESAIKWIQEAGRQAERATQAEAELRARDAAPIVGERGDKP